VARRDAEKVGDQDLSCCFFATDVKGNRAGDGRSPSGPIRRCPGVENAHGSMYLAHI
jgi:hypothetical protein